MPCRYVHTYTCTGVGYFELACIRCVESPVGVGVRCPHRNRFVKTLRVLFIDQVEAESEDGSGQMTVEKTCSEWLSQLAAQGVFGSSDLLGADTIVLGFTACRVLGLLLNPPQPQSQRPP